ncbi:rho GTPase-activating protein 17-like isoform X2 [Mobula hypostoma]|uniref:rho GTPase-activating protein 17-like isoform X2 n=1 Tax=Mobula hypostoma TaxID=723540 RepID=UPI002FC2FCCD
MKKQFNRMRQLANQTVGRAEKTEVLSDDLLQIEKRMDTIRIISHNIHKRLSACLQVQQGTDVDKRCKKLPLMALSQSMQEGLSSLGDDSLITKLLETCSEAENKLAHELASYESQIEKDILDPFSNLSEMEIPNIQKQRKQLAKLVLDWDSAKMRYNQAHKTAFSGANFQAIAAKVDSLREEMDEAGNKVELCKDQLAADMYNFISKEGDYARYLVMLLEAQADYHRKSLAVLERVLPTIQTQQDTWTEKPAFGTALEEHLKRSGREIALPIEACVMMLLETGMKEEGLFRIAAGASKLKKLKAALDCSTSQLEEFYSDPHAVAGALKSYLRELPEPLMTFQLYDEWVQAASVPEPDKKLQALWLTCSKMPKSHSSNFRYLIKFLSKLAQYSEMNKMTPSNIAIVLGPNLLWAKNEGMLADLAAATSVHMVTIIEPIIQHADWFFPDDLDFNVSGMFTPMTPYNHLNNVPVFVSDCDSSTLERKRPVSVTAVEDVSKRDSFGVKIIESQLNPRRSGTLTRKHTSPTVQPPPPPPPTEAVLMSEQQQSGVSPGPCPATVLPLAARVTEPHFQETDETSLSKSKDPAATIPLSRNGAGGASVVQSPPQPSGTGVSQLTAVPGPVTTGPSPHITRRDIWWSQRTYRLVKMLNLLANQFHIYPKAGHSLDQKYPCSIFSQIGCAWLNFFCHTFVDSATKKPAPAPPKPSNPPPGQPVDHGASTPVNQTTTHSPKQPSQVASTSPGQSGNQSSVQSHGQSSSQLTMQSRKHSSNQMVIQAPNHPPPQPPVQPINPYPCKASSEQAAEQPSSTPPDTPTPPSTPPLGTHGAGLQLTQHFTHAQSFPANQDLQSQTPLTQFATVPRARPVPKPRNRPSVPPPPQPPVTAGATSSSTPTEPAFSNTTATASKIVTDSDSTVKEQDWKHSKPSVESTSVSGSMEMKKCEQQDVDNDSESTAL